MGKVKITIIDYSEKKYSREEAIVLDGLEKYKRTPSVTWIDIAGIPDPETIREIGELFGIHSLYMEDILDTRDRTRVEIAGDSLLCILQIFSGEAGLLESEQVSILLWKNLLVTFRSGEQNIFEPVRKRIEIAGGRIRKMGTDYLFYCLLDIIGENYFQIVNRISGGIENLEDEILDNPLPEHLRRIHYSRKELMLLRKSIWPLREIMNTILRGESLLITRDTFIFFKDEYNQTMQMIDHVETYRDVLIGLSDTYLSAISHRMNSVIKVLTLIATIFIPLTFVAGVYGMNFEFMPGLHWKWGYYIMMFVMALIGGGMMLYFKIKKWF